MHSLAKFSKNKKLQLIYVGGFALLLAAALFGMLCGSGQLSISELWRAVCAGPGAEAGTRIFWYARLPRVCAGMLCGAALAVSGAVIQNVLANRLASPGIIGTNAGAGLAVTLCAAFGIYGGFRLSVFSFLGAFLAVLLVSGAASRWRASRGTVILIGVSVNSLLNAISDVVLTFKPDIRVITADFKIGVFSWITYQKLLPAAVLILLTLFVLFTLTNALDVLTLGEDNARGLGMNTRRMRLLFLLFSALLAGCAVSLAGLLSFVGLIVPHAVRRLGGGKASHLLPLCALYGAGFVTLCDTAARTIFAPYEVPVGVLMSLLGVPFFLFILVKGKGGHAR